TLNAGLSVHPCPGYTKRDILGNASKALVHAGFLGTDSQVLFDAVSLNINGDRLYEAGRMDKAVEEFRRALNLDPSNANVRNSLGVCYAQMGRFEDALAEFSRIAELEPSDFMPHYNLGCALLGLDREAEAERAFSQAAEMEPQNAGIWFQLAKLCKRQNRLREAVAHLSKAVELKSNWVQAWRLLGECLLEQGAVDSAMNAFKKALKLNGKDGAAMSGLALAYGLVEANLEIALSLARRSTELEPDNPLFAQRLAELFLQNRNLDEAMEECARAMSMGPKNTQLRQLKNKIAAAQRDSTS
ncbi:MAG: tetratricopeptide repeat protein, partial [Deltaproteobacteria bacterium]